jgi:predicted flap endonuclease-1-like 5' DNA nuclease
LRGKLDELETRLQDSRREADALRARHGAAAADTEPDGTEDAKAQAGLQRAASAERALSRVTSERDELLARVRQLEAELAAESQIGVAGNDSAQQKAARGALREKLAAAEHRGNELSIRVTDREARITELEQELESWKQHVVPLTRQIRSYRETLRNLQQPRPESPAKATAAGAAGGSPADRLQAIRGIGPALERRLNAQGIHCYAQLAALDPAELAHLAERLAISPTLPKRDCWIEQARALAAAPNGQTATA